jgi:hypothetical protein
VYEWTSPHGYRFRVDATGTHPLGKSDSRVERDQSECRQRPRRPRTAHTVSVARVGSGWMETYQPPFTIEVDEDFQRI